MHERKLRWAGDPEKVPASSHGRRDPQGAERPIPRFEEHGASRVVHVDYAPGRVHANDHGAQADRHRVAECRVTQPELGLWPLVQPWPLFAPSGVDDRRARAHGRDAESERTDGFDMLDRGLKDGEDHVGCRYGQPLLDEDVVVGRRAPL